MSVCHFSPAIGSFNCLTNHKHDAIDKINHSILTPSIGISPDKKLHFDRNVKTLQFQFLIKSPVIRHKVVVCSGFHYFRYKALLCTKHVHRALAATNGTVMISNCISLRPAPRCTDCAPIWQLLLVRTGCGMSWNGTSAHDQVKKNMPSQECQ